MVSKPKVTAGDLLSTNQDALNKALTGGWMRGRCVITRWDDRIRDEVLTEEVKKNHNVSGNKVGDFYKRLMGDARGELDAVNSALSAVRTVFYDVTKKLDRDFYAFPVADAPNTIKRLTEAKQVVEELKEKLRAAWPKRVAQAKTQMGSMTDALEYPNVEDVLSRMTVTLKFEPIPDMRTFDNMALPADVAATFASQVANQQTELVSSMVTDLYDDLVETTADLARYFGNKAAGEKGSKLYDSKVAKIQRLSKQLQAAEGIVTTDFSNLAEQVDKLAAVDFDAAKASVTVAETTRDLAQGVHKALNKLGATPTAQAEPPITTAPEAPADDATTDDDELEANIEAALDTPEPEYEVNPPAEDDKQEPNKDDPFAALDSLFF